MHVSTNWTAHPAAMGNAPGDHAGRVVITTADGQQWEADSAKVTLAAEQGSLLGVQAGLDDGRRVFVFAGGWIIDASPGGSQ